MIRGTINDKFSFEIKGKFIHIFNTFLTVDPDGKSVVPTPDPNIPEVFILQLHQLKTGAGMSLEDTVTNGRGSLVLECHSPFPF